MSPIALPVLALVQDDRESLIRTLKILVTVFSIFGIPAFAFAIIFAKQILSNVYRPDYAVMAAPFSIYCLYIFALICSSLNMNVYIAVGQPHIHRNAAIIRTVLFLILIYPATKGFGLIGTASSACFAMIVSLSVQLIYLRALIDLDVRDYIKWLFKGGQLSLLVVIPGLLLVLLSNLRDIYLLSIGGVLCLTAWSLGLRELIGLRETFCRTETARDGVGISK